MLFSEGSDVRTVESERVMSMLHSEGPDVRIVAFRVDSGESVLSIHHGWHNHMSS